MKKLLLKCFLLLILIGGILYASGLAYKQTNTYKNLNRNDDIEKYQSIPESVDIAIFGSSHGVASFKTAPEGKALFNFALSSQVPFYDLRVMRQYKNYICPGALVILTVGPGNPFYLQPQETLLRYQPRYYRFMDAENIVDVDIFLYFRTKISPLLTEDFPQILDAFLADQELALTTDEQTGHRQTSVEEMPDEIARIKRSHISSDISSFPEESTVMTDSYREMLRMCEENDWNAVLVTPPYLAEYCECYAEYDAEYFKVFENTMQSIADEFGVPFLDYSRDPYYANRYDLFKNIDHLNLEGATMFNERFYQDVQMLDVL